MTEMRSPGEGTRRRETGYSPVLVELGTSASGQSAAPHDRSEHLAAVQGVRPDDRVSRAEAPRPAARSRDGGLHRASRPGASPRLARASADRDDAGLRADSTRAAEGVGQVL